LAVERAEWGAEAFALASAACLIGDLGWYCAGRAYGGRIMRLLCRVSVSPDSCVSETQFRFERWGIKAIAFAKFVPGLSTIAPPLAGAVRMRLGRYLGVSTLGTALWVGSLMAIGALAAKQIVALLPRLAALGGRALIALALLLALYVLLKWLERRRFYSALRMARIDVTELHSLIQSNHPPTVLDVRSRTAQELDPRMVPGALHVPPEDVATLLASIQHGEEVVVYCACPNEASAARVARLLMQHGVLRVRPLYGGLEAWIAAGYPVGPVAPAPGLATARLVSSR
jgi:membrane protein DedA with SNARE-associated domain/rhodanese-related sulfurtransferase